MDCCMPQSKHSSCVQVMILDFDVHHGNGTQVRQIVLPSKVIV